MNFHQKYLKYKNKYNSIKHQGGASNNALFDNNAQDTFYGVLLSLPSEARRTHLSLQPFTIRSNIAFMSRVIKLDYRLYEVASECLKENREFIHIMNQKLFELINQDIVNGRENTDQYSLLPSLSYFLDIQIFARSQIWEKVLVNLLLEKPEVLQYMPSSIRGNRSLIEHIRDTGINMPMGRNQSSLALSKRFKILDYISDDLAEDETFAEENKRFAIQVAREAYILRNRERFNYYRFDTIFDTGSNDSNFPNMSRKLMLDRDVVLAFLKVDGNNFRYINNHTLKSDMELVLTALFYGLDIAILFDDYQNHEACQRRLATNQCIDNLGHFRGPTEADERRIIDLADSQVRIFKYIILGGLKTLSRNVETISYLEENILNIKFGNGKNYNSPLAVPLDLDEKEYVQSSRLITLMDFKNACVEKKNIIYEAMEIWLQEKQLRFELDPIVVSRYKFLPPHSPYRYGLGDNYHLGIDFPLKIWWDYNKILPSEGREQYSVERVQSDHIEYILEILGHLVHNNGLLLHFITELNIFNEFYTFYSDDESRVWITEKIRDILNVAVEQNGLALAFIEPKLTITDDEHASKTFIYCETLIHIAVTQNGLALKYVHEFIKRYNNIDKKYMEYIILTAVRQNGLALKYAHCKNIDGTRHSFRDNENIVRTAVICHQPGDFVINNANGLALEFASERLRNDRGIVRAAVSCDGLALQFASNNLRSDPGIVRIAIENNPRAIEYALGDLENVSPRSFNYRNIIRDEIGNR